MVETCKESFKGLYKSFNSNAAGDLCASYLFDISGENGGKWSLIINKGSCELKEGVIENPTVTISISDRDWIEMQNGKLNSQMAFMMGKLRVAGDMSLALKLQSLFPGAV